MIVFVADVVCKSAHVQVGVFECVRLYTVLVIQDFIDSLEIGILGEGTVLIGKCQLTSGGIPIEGV